MHAWRRIAAPTLAAITLLGSACADPNDDGLRLPSVIGSPDPEVVPAAFHGALLPHAPRPPALRRAAAPRPPRPLEVHAAASRSEPARDSASEALAVRQLEHAAGDASSPHALARLLRRYESVRSALSDPALRRRADRVASWAIVARTEVDPRDPADDLSDLRQAVKLDPESVSARLALATTLAFDGDEVAALDTLDALVARDPACVVALLNRATLRLRRGDAAGAITDCDVALAGADDKAAERPSLLVLRGVALHAEGRLREAGAAYDAALAAEPGRADALTARGHVYADAGLYDQALADYLAAARSASESVEAYRSLAWLLATCPDDRLRNPATALEAASRALRLGGEEDPLALESAAAAHASAGEFGEAVRRQQQAVLLLGGAPHAPPEIEDRLRLYERGEAFVAERPGARR